MRAVGMGGPSVRGVCHAQYSIHHKKCRGQECLAPRAQESSPKRVWPRAGTRALLHDGTDGDGGPAGTTELVAAAYRSPDGGWHSLPRSQPETAASGDTGHAHGDPEAAQ